MASRPPPRATSSPGSSTRRPPIGTALSEILKYLGGGSIDALKGKTIGYLYFDAAFGREALPFFQSLAKDVGFNLKLYPVAPADMQNQSSKWLDIRRDNPDFLVMYGWGAMNPTAIKEAVKAEFPMDKFVSIWWPNDAGRGLRRRRRQGLQGAQLAWRGRELSRLRRHPEAGHRRRQEPDAEGSKSARCSTIAASTTRC